MTEKQIIKLMKFPLTDQGNAERLRFIFGNRWKYLPRYRLWLHWNGHRWEGRRTVNLIWTAGDMFHELILAICRLPFPEDFFEQRLRLHVIEWLTRSQAICHCEMAVKYFREMVREENDNKSIHNNA